MGRSAKALLWSCAALALALLAGIAWWLAPLEPGILALQMAFTPLRFGEVIHAWPAEHLLRYRQHLLPDFVLLLTYATLGYLLARRTRLFAPLGPRATHIATWCWPLAAVFDAAENALHYWLTEVPRFDVPMVYAVSGSCSLLKWLLLLAFGALVALALARSEA